MVFHFGSPRFLSLKNNFLLTFLQNDQDKSDIPQISNLIKVRLHRTRSKAKVGKLREWSLTSLAQNRLTISSTILRPVATFRYWGIGVAREGRGPAPNQNTTNDKKL